jgi:putative DNA methylase
MVEYPEMIPPTRKKLIEVALPLEAINKEGSRRKRKAPLGYPTTLHKWWAQRPVAAARAVIFAQMVDDPSSFPDLFRTESKQEKERGRLLRIIEDLVKWENTTNEAVLQRARDEIWRSWRRACADSGGHPETKELFDRNKLPAFHDPFAGSGAIPLEAQRLGLDSRASDLNPVAVLINKAMIEIPPRFAGGSPVNPRSRSERSLDPRQWREAQGLAEDVRYYGEWICDEAEKRIGHLYPKVKITADMVSARPDLKPLLGQELTVIAWLWARTVKSPNPAFANVDVPLASTFMLSNKAGKEAYIDPVVEGGGYRFTVRMGKPKDAEVAKSGTKLARGANFQCLMSGTPIAGDYIKAEGRAGRMGARLMAIVVDGQRGRVYLAPTTEQETIAGQAKPEWKPETPLASDPRALWTPLYGLTTYGDLFTDRQLVALTAFSDLVGEAMARIRRDAVAGGLADDGRALRDGGSAATAYAEAVGMYLALAVDRAVDYNSTIATWRPKDGAMRSSLAKQAIPMSWDFAEGSLFGDSSSGFTACVDVIASVMGIAFAGQQGEAYQADAAAHSPTRDLPAVISTDPPYYDNIGYADLSDFFYVWLRRSLRPVFPDLFPTLAVPKAEELVANVYRHGGKEMAEEFFLEGMTKAMHRLAQQSHPAFPVTIYYAFKQAESESDTGVASTGWETFLDAVIRAGFGISGTWPMRTEGDNRQIGIGNNALASSIVLVCRSRSANAPIATRREFITVLKAELPSALRHLQAGNIAPVDLAQAAIGPGMGVYTRYGKVLDAEGKSVSVREALMLINQTLDEALAEQEGDFDSDSRWAVAWFEQCGFAEGEFGVADVLARAKNTAVSGLVQAGIVVSKAGKVRLLKPEELAPDWDPATDPRLTVWEVVHHLIRALEAGGEGAAAQLVAKLGAKSEIARELAYRLYTVCERKKRAAEALSYNGLVQSWPEITHLARESPKVQPAQAQLFEQE